MSAIAVIPARGGSRRIPRKNIRMFYGKPIIAYSIETALGSGLFEKVVVSTDDKEIAEVARKYGAEVLDRPEALARDEVGTQEVMAHALSMFLGYDIACCIYPTAPMLSGDDLLSGMHVLLHPWATYTMSVNTEPLYDAGQFYWGYTGAFIRRVPLIGLSTAMIPIDKDRVCDINTEEDWVLAQLKYRCLMEGRLQKCSQTKQVRLGKCLSPSGVCDQTTCFDRCAWGDQ